MRMSHSEVFSKSSGRNLVSLKEPSHQIRIAWKWYGRIGLGEDMRRWIFKYFKSSFQFLISLWCSRDPHQLLTNSLFLRKLARVDTSQLRIPTYCLLKLLDHWGSVFLLFPCFLLFEPWSPSHTPIWVLCISRWIGKQDWGEIRQCW